MKEENSATKDLTDDEQGKNHFLVVGIGASAGGVQALKEFFKHVPEGSGIAYVVILHLSPDFDSQLTGILQGVTLLPVIKVDVQVKIQPDHTYVVPPNKSLKMVDGTITVEEIHTVEERRAPVDIFFRSLAESHRAHAVAVVLSGTGANGSMGMKRVKERGGVVFVQNPREAEYSDMPRNSIATELVDEILNVAEIPAKIVAYKQNMGTVDIPLSQEALQENEQAALREIFTQLRVRTGHDFANYKRATVLRRLERRINVRQLTSLPAYAAFLRETPEEAHALLKDLLISVTNFFRDKEAFTYLEKKIIPKIFEGKVPGQPVRIWIAGCATGEEAYSLAMLVCEHLRGAKEPPAVQIFATDIDDAAIAAAREGFYTLNDAADVLPDRLRSFFVPEAEGYRVKRELREMILFANHNVIKNPPFSHLDLVTCRNMLIYLNQVAQNRVMETFHFALNPGGYLFLGSSESVDGANDLYVSVSKPHHVFQSREAVTRPIPVPDNTLPPAFTIKLPGAEEAGNKNSHEQETRALERISLGVLHQRLVEQYAPPSVVVNENYDVLHISESAGRFFRHPGGEPSNNILKIIKQELRAELRSALYQAVQKQANTEVKNVAAQTGGEPEIINIQVRPVLRTEDTARGFLLVVFEPSQNKAPEDVVQITSMGEEPLTRQLDEEITSLRLQLRSSNEQFEVQTEELRASNEELQAINEELRSSAEELETSKEELQSINEELITVNQELKVKIEEVSQSSNDFQNLINSTDIGTVFLDRYFRVKMFTPPAREIFNLIQADLGRPITDITSRLAYSDLLQDAETVIKKLQTIEREVKDINNHTYLMQITPYRTAEDQINGVVILFVNITKQKNAEDALRESEKELAAELEKTRNLYHSNSRLFAAQNMQQALQETLTSSIHLLGADFGNMQFYDAERGVLKIAAQQGFKENFLNAFETVDANDNSACGRVIRTGARCIIEDTEKDEAYTPYLPLSAEAGFRAVQSTPLYDYEGKLLGVLSTHFKEPHVFLPKDLNTLDLYATQAASFISRTRAEEALRRSQSQLSATLESATDYAIISFTTEGLVESWSKGAALTFGYTEQEVKGQSGAIIFTPEDREAGVLAWEMKTAAAEGRAADERWHQRKDGSRFYMSGVMAPIHSNKTLTGYVKVARDMTKQKNAEEAMRMSEERFRIALEAGELGAWDWATRSKTVKWNQQHFILFGKEPAGETVELDEFFTALHPEDADYVRQQLVKAVEETGIYQAEFRIVRSDNKEIRWMNGYGRVTERSEGKATRMTGVIYDSTERKRLEQQKDEFIGVASHELKTPITSIKAYAEVLREMFEEDNNDNSAVMMHKLDAQVDRLTGLIRNLLDTTKISEGQLMLHREQTDLNKLVTESIEDLQRITQKHHIVFTPGNITDVTADRERIQQVVINLVTNAIKYSPDGGEITITTGQEANNVKVSVQDQGIGIQSDMLERVFDRFFRVSNPQSHTFPGMGLGLYISSGIVQRHGGIIGLTSSPGKGSVFYFTLPVPSQQDVI